MMVKQGERLATSRCKAVSIYTLTGLTVVAIILYRSSMRPTLNHISSFIDHTGRFRIEGGDCAAIGRRRPIWDNHDAMRAALKEFAEIYGKRPIRYNKGGMRFDHSFALWFTLRAISPTPRVVIESGAFKGHSTWIIRTALPTARIVSISPDLPEIVLDNVDYRTGKNFTDFKALTWDEIVNDSSNALVFFDDHQASFRRIFEEAVPRGFRRFIVEDNYDIGKGDSTSLKVACEVEREHLWSGFVADNFGKSKTPQTWQQHLDLHHVLRRSIKFYYEFPPIAATNVTGQTRYDENHASKPLLTTTQEFERVFKGDLAKDLDEFRYYTHFCYVETHTQ